MKTDGLEERLEQLLNDPDSMAQILSMAKSFGLSPEDVPSSAPPPPPEDGLTQALLGVMQQVRKSDGRQEALLRALRAYLAPERQEKLDRAMQLARISHLAGAALGQYGIAPDKGGK